ncbi:MAG: hypothetical protein U0136_19590 [Bdellovibrionota bacterium]
MDAIATKIVFNGKEYASKEEMPAAERSAFEKLTQHFEDRNGNGIPDCFESTGDIQVGKCVISAKLIDGKQEIVLNNKSFASPAEMSADERKIYDAAMALLDKNSDGVPDAFQTLSPEQIQSAFGTHTQTILLSRNRKHASVPSAPSLLFLKAVSRLGAVIALGYLGILIWENSR